MKAISLFSGAGGFEIGFGRAGIETVLQAENDQWCLSVLERHWPDVERMTDVRQVNTATFQGRSRNMARAGCSTGPERLRHASGRSSSTAGTGPDLIYGGFPCQDVSVAGKRAGLSGDRSGLFYEFARVVRDLRPRWFAVENVPGLLSSADGADFGTILGTMVELGYGVAWRILDGRWFGVPQRRRRVLVVGCAGDARRAAQVLAVCESCGGHPAPRRETGEAVAGSLSAGAHPSGFNGQDAYTGRLIAGTIGSHHGNVRADQAWTGQLVTAAALHASDGHHGHSSPRGDGADNLIAFSNRGNVTAGAETLRAGSHGAIPMAGGSMGVRRLTPLECERLMAWPDDHTRWTADGREIPDSHRYRMCGNGVIATVAEWLGHRLMRAEQLRVEVPNG